MMVVTIKKAPQYVNGFLIFIIRFKIYLLLIDTYCFTCDMLFCYKKNIFLKK